MLGGSWSLFSYVEYFKYNSFIINRTLKQFWGIETIFHEGGVVSIRYPLHGLANQIMYYLIYDIIGTLVPIIITYIFYFQVCKALKKGDNYEKEASLHNPRRVLIYSFIQFICFFPGILFYGIFMFQGKIAPFGVAVVVSFTRRSWGFLNLLAYWFFKVGEQENNSHCDEEVNRSEYTHMVNDDITY